MARPSRRSLQACMLGVLVAACPALIGSSSIASRPDVSCDALHQWATQYQHASPTLAQLAQVDRAHRIAIFNSIPTTVRAELWREQLRQFRQWPTLSELQRAAIDSRRAHIEAATYEGGGGQSAGLRREWLRLAPLFPQAAQRRAWFDLGAVVPVTSAPTPSLYDQLTQPFRGRTMGVTWCECSFSYGNVECYPGGCGSSPCTQKTGCGFTGADTCSGMCM